MKILDRLIDIWNRYDTKILTGVAVAGAVVTPVLASRATLKAKDIIDEYKDQAGTKEVNGDEECDDVQDCIQKPWYKDVQTWKKLAPVYAPAIASGVVTIGCIISCEKIHVDNELELSMISAFWEGRYLKLNNAVNKKYGEEEINDLKKDILKETAEYHKKECDLKSPLLADEVHVGRNSYFWVYDPLEEDYFKTCLNDLSAAVCRANQKCANCYTMFRCSYNDMRRFLGAPKCKKFDGDRFGWSYRDDDLVECMSYNGDTWLDAYIAGPEGIDPVKTKDGEYATAFALCFNYGPMPFKD